MIIGSFTKLNIGQLYNDGKEGIIDKNGNKHIIPHLVMREATLDEYIEELHKDGGKLNPSQKLWLTDPRNEKYFYEVSID